VSTPRVSILLPAFDAEDTLPACLRSIERQTERTWECIVVDDGSRDGTRACAEGFARRDQRFRIIAVPHGGLVAALNVGLTACRAPLIARMDADDLMHRERLALQLAALAATPRLAAVGSHVRLFPRAGLRVGLRRYERWLNSIDSPSRLRTEAFVECPIVHPTLMVRTEVLRYFRYRDAGWPEDYDLVLRLLARGCDIGIVPRRLLSWRDRPGCLTRTAAQYGRERFPVCKASFLAEQFLAAGDEYVLWGYGETGRSIRRALLRHGKRPSHVVEVHPRRLGQRIDGAPVIGVDELLQRPRTPIVASVAGERPRRLIRHALEGAGLRETRDFICVA
jgi:glycosyltransferase involved in cell wall biosynthesis